MSKMILRDFSLRYQALIFIQIITANDKVATTNTWSSKIPLLSINKQATLEIWQPATWSASKKAFSVIAVQVHRKKQRNAAKLGAGLLERTHASLLVNP